jgi:hypothetical protein
VVEHSPQYPKDDGLSSATAIGTGREKISIRTSNVDNMYFIIDCVNTTLGNDDFPRGYPGRGCPRRPPFSAGQPWQQNPVGWPRLQRPAILRPSPRQNVPPQNQVCEKVYLTVKLGCF